MSASFYLTDNEIADLCKPLVQPAAQVRYLRQLGLHVEKKPNGRPVVVRAHAEAILSGRAAELAATQPANVVPIKGPGPDLEGFRARRGARAL